MRYALNVLGLLLGVGLAGFFAYYSVRLCYVWVARVQPGQAASGMYIGAVAFPVLAVMGALLARRSWRGLHRRGA
jgi:hypothetical protein